VSRWLAAYGWDVGLTLSSALMPIVAGEVDDGRDFGVIMVATASTWAVVLLVRHWMRVDH
jgi:hypothetical protein